MSTTILEALQGSDYIFTSEHYVEGVTMRRAKARLHNATILLEKGYSLYDEIDLILEEYDDVGDVPDCDD